jgi:hypothetical protein
MIKVQLKYKKVICKRTSFGFNQPSIVQWGVSLSQEKLMHD